MEIRSGMLHLGQKRILIATVDHLLHNVQAQPKKGRDVEKEQRIPMADAIYMDNHI
jgi:hypothetical protein